MGKQLSLTLVVVAAHHNTNNVASQRFRELLKYLDTRDLRTFVVSRQVPGGESNGTYQNIPVVGNVYTRSAGLPHLLILLLCALYSKLPLLIQRFTRWNWAINASSVAADIVSSELSQGRRCIVLGTFCPLDSLVAARCAAGQRGALLIQDFRDGLGFEPIGHQGWGHMMIKRLFEWSTSRSANALITVSEPIAAHLRTRFPHKRVQIIPNGYDREIFDAEPAAVSQAADRFVRRYVTPNAILLGHFGRVRLSDPTSQPSLTRLLSALSELPRDISGKVHLLFMGELSRDEEVAVCESGLHFSLLKPRSRHMAIAFMRKMDGLLLLTGTRRSVVTGKVFDYLAVRRSILQFTCVRNEASRIILAHSNMHLICVGPNEPVPSVLQRWVASLGDVTLDYEVDKSFDKLEQARAFKSLLREVAVQMS
ncbi:glycosyltransferase [Parahaliea aestuarii]|uniref:Glycosyltransferase family 4 protein n=1 Tax=Parahaliea aestuarii TaxID=1852021 RepID=A0A5C9A3F9_9GAMM|nr:glycosyltransferase [Parahaliea aestuarii]TXS94534.1 glycosyltransferase family 4 protein [Parahaliea aestuarii]